MELSLGDFIFIIKSIVMACDCLNDIKHHRLASKLIEGFRKD